MLFRSTFYQRRMRVLWICNTVLPEFASEFKLKPTVIEGWITGMLHQMERKAEIALCFPLMDQWRKKDGELNGHQYYSFSYSAYEYSTETEEKFESILREYKPDIIHIWGTEFPHALAMIKACERIGKLDKVVINIQGLIEPYSLCYLEHIPDRFLDEENECGESLRKAKKEFEVRGIYEREVLYKVKHVIGRTDWDCAWVKHINSNIIYHCAGEILRDEFYEIKRNWSYEACEKYAIFVSQATYAIKGLDYLLHALPDIVKDYPDVHVYVAGKNPAEFNQKTGSISSYGLYLKDIMDEIGLQEKVTFLGRLNSQQMIDMYLRANVFVSCSRIENSPNSVCEAAIVGTPIVASFVGGMKNLAEKIANIYLYQPGAEYMLAFYIRKVFKKEKFNVYTEDILEIMDRKRNVEDTWEIYRKINSCSVQEEN